MSDLLSRHTLEDYPYPSRLPRMQDGFTISVEDPTLQFNAHVAKALDYLNGWHGIARIELHEPFLFVHFNPDDSEADYDKAVELVIGSSKGYLEPFEPSEQDNQEDF